MKIGVFKADVPLTLTPCQNGGWVVTQGTAGAMIIPANLGAYSHAEDMLDALSEALVHPANDET